MVARCEVFVVVMLMMAAITMMIRWCCGLDQPKANAALTCEITITGVKPPENRKHSLKSEPSAHPSYTYNNTYRVAVIEHLLCVRVICYLSATCVDARNEPKHNQIKANKHTTIVFIPNYPFANVFHQKEQQNTHSKTSTLGRNNPPQTRHFEHAIVTLHKAQ